MFQMKKFLLKSKLVSKLKSKLVSKKFLYTLVALSLMACESTGGDICGMYIC